MKNAVLVTTKHRGVFYGHVAVEDMEKENLWLTDCRMAIAWNTTRGLLELAQVGPNEGSRISDTAEKAYIRDATGVFLVSKEAQDAWERV